MKTLEAQKAILGTLIIDRAAYTKVCEIAAPYMFEEGTTRLVAEAIWDYNRNQQDYDAALISSRVPGANLNELADSATTREILPAHAEDVRNEYYERETLRYQQEMQVQLKEGAPYFEAHQDYQRKVEILHAGMQVADRKADVLRAANDDVIKAMTNDGIAGIPSPWPNINEFSGGFYHGDLNYFAARPGMGKTTFLCQSALHAAEQGFPVAFFSMGDMTAKALYTKMACMMAGLHMKSVRTGGITQHEHNVFWQQIEKINDLPIYVYDSRDVARRINSVTDKMRVCVEQYGIQMMIVDYVQQLQTDNNYHSANDRLTRVSGELKNAAITLDVCMNVASQLSRAVETRGGIKRPQLSDLRESGALEQDADNVAALYRPAYYNIDQDEEGNDISKRTEIIHLKDRVGGDELPHTSMLTYQNHKLVAEKTDSETYNSYIDADARIEPRAQSDDSTEQGSDDFEQAMQSPIIRKTATIDEDIPF